MQSGRLTRGARTFGDPMKIHGREKSSDDRADRGTVGGNVAVRGGLTL